jgi:BTB/POZ domain-containing adapter for CUL3-mediated RhoA degradation protein
MSGDHLPKLSMSSSTALLTTGVSGLTLSNSTTPANKLSYPTSFTTTSSLTSNHRYVKLNVGGRLFSTSIDTLTKQDNMLRAMFSGRMDLTTDLDGYILIDRCGRWFEMILNYLRDEDLNINLDEKSEFELYEILKEVKFYCIQPLISLIEQKILSLKSASQAEPYYGSSVVSMVTSKNDLIKILNSTDKPCIRLLINRHNNKYSYTNNSDDNLLKNIELFERMAIKFKNRIMFIKDTASTEEICCWYFHGNGKKLSEVCCTSIVYTTEKKQTKVEFPDSKILEEIFVNAVLFESKETNGDNASYNQQMLGHLADGDDNNIDEYYVPPPPRISISNAAGTGLNLNSSSTSTASNVVGSVSNSSNSNINNSNIVGSTSSNIGITSANCVINSNTSNSTSSNSNINSSSNNNGNNNGNNSNSHNNSSSSNSRRSVR